MNFKQIHNISFESAGMSEDETIVIKLKNGSELIIDTNSNAVTFYPDSESTDTRYVMCAPMGGEEAGGFSGSKPYLLSYD